MEYLPAAFELGLEFWPEREIPHWRRESRSVEAPRYVNAKGKSKKEKSRSEPGPDKEIFPLSAVGGRLKRPPTLGITPCRPDINKRRAEHVRKANG